jgi:PAS domain S-box-containing protein
MSVISTDKRKINILLVEDNPGDARLINEMLKNESAPFELETVGRLTAAFEKLKGSKYDVMLLDLGLPDSQGIETMQKVQKLATDLPIIILTGLADEQIGIQAVEQGAQDFLIKWEASEAVLARTINYAIERKKADERLRKSEQHLELAVNGADLGLWDWDVTTCQITYNERTAQIIGGEPGVLSLKIETLSSIIHPDDLPGARQKIQAHMNGETPVIDMQCRINGRTSRWNWVQISGKAVERDEEGKPLRAAGIIKDVSELFLAHEALRQSEERYRNIVETAGEGICVLDAEDRIIFTNQQMADMFGYKIEEMLARSILNFMDDEARNIAQGHIERRRTGIKERYDSRYRRRDGSEFWGIVSATPLIDGESGKYRGSLIMLADINERKIGEIRDKARFVLLNRLRTAKTIDDCLQFGCKALTDSKLFGRAVFMFYNDTGNIVNFGQTGLNKNSVGSIKHGNAPDEALLAGFMQPKYRISKSYYIGQGSQPAPENSFPNISLDAEETKGSSWKRGDILIVPIYQQNSNKYDGLVSAAFPFEQQRPPSQDLIQHLEEIVDMVTIRSREIYHAEALNQERQALAEKNVALKEIMSVVEAEKMEIRKQIAGVIDQVLKPAVNRLMRRDGSVNKTYYDLLKYNLDELAIATGGALHMSSKLSPREMEICAMIKNGSSSKDIAEALDIALVTVQKHREVIRKKLGLTNKNINLTTHLRNM